MKNYSSKVLISLIIFLMALLIVFTIVGLANDNSSILVIGVSGLTTVVISAFVFFVSSEVSRFFDWYKNLDKGSIKIGK